MDSRRALALDALLLDFVDERYPLSEGCVGRVLASRDGAADVKVRLDGLIGAGFIERVSGGRLVRTQSGSKALQGLLKKRG